MKTVEKLIQRAWQAQAELEHFTQQQVDDIVKAFAQTVYDNADMLAEMAVTETHMGKVEDKILKNKIKSELIYDNIKNEKTIGVIKRDEQHSIVEIAEPVGVVAAIIPCTNPTVTAMSNAMFAIKTRNAIVIAPHPRAEKTTEKTVELLITATKKFGLPEHAVQVVTEPNKEKTQDLMHQASVVLATGGAGMVRAAYSSGKPSFGVGAGNVPAVVHHSADVATAVANIIQGKTFDNGLICSSEQSLITSIDMSSRVWDELKAQGAYICSVPEVQRLRYAMFNEDDHINPNIIGQDAKLIAQLARIELPEDIKLLVVPVEGVGLGYPFSGEKMSPVLGLYITKNFSESIRIAKQILEFEGKGHTASIHTTDDDSAIDFALQVKASRVIVNQPSSTSSGGSRFNWLTPTTTLGCGTWGGNITSDNISARHLLNIKRVAYKLPKERPTTHLSLQQ